MMKLPTPLYPGKCMFRGENNDKSKAHMTNYFISNAAEEDYEHQICPCIIRAGGFLRRPIRKHRRTHVVWVLNKRYMTGIMVSHDFSARLLHTLLQQKNT